MDCSEDGGEITQPMLLPFDSSSFFDSNTLELPPFSTKATAEGHKVAEKFCKAYYETIQKKRHLFSQFYLETSVMIWDGNPVLGRDQIQKFIEHLPSLTFSLNAMDTHPASVLAVGPRKAYFIKIAGMYRVSGPGCQKQFSQDIIVTAEGDKWRIASDIFRTVN
ncbi:unnamed protein product [Orchesella dallaii]|uniref:NTF2 domain-containing protein n=1 Tax=Orchesella dallaii TaxID=48710 RepID=A0ABP1R3R2_9HEXA